MRLTAAARLPRRAVPKEDVSHGCLLPCDLKMGARIPVVAWWVARRSAADRPHDAARFATGTTSPGRPGLGRDPALEALTLFRDREGEAPAEPGEDAAR